MELSPEMLLLPKLHFSFCANRPKSANWNLQGSLNGTMLDNTVGRLAVPRRNVVII